MKRMSWWIELGGVRGWDWVKGWLRGGRERGGSGILVLGEPGLEIDQLEMGMDGAEAGALGAREVTAASISDREAGGLPEGGGTKEAN